MFKEYKIVYYSNRKPVQVPRSIKQGTFKVKSQFERSSPRPGRGGGGLGGRRGGQPPKQLRRARLRIPLRRTRVDPTKRRYDCADRPGGAGLLARMRPGPGRHPCRLRPSTHPCHTAASEVTMVHATYVSPVAGSGRGCAIKRRRSRITSIKGRGMTSLSS